MTSFHLRKHRLFGAASWMSCRWIFLRRKLCLGKSYFLALTVFTPLPLDESKKFFDIDFRDSFFSHLFHWWFIQEHALRVFYFFLGKSIALLFSFRYNRFRKVLLWDHSFPNHASLPAQTSTLPIASGEGSPLNALRKHREKGKGPLVSYISPVLFVKKPLRCQAKQDVTYAEFFGIWLLNSFGETIISNIKPPSPGAFCLSERHWNIFWKSSCLGVYSL